MRSQRRCMCGLKAEEETAISDLSGVIRVHATWALADEADGHSFMASKRVKSHSGSCVNSRGGEETKARMGSTGASGELSPGWALSGKQEREQLTAQALVPTCLA
ncbi:hypothetical protein P7K49_014937 [Saguinus oedipus]|uniref:Uncharacterized protein n=1 Tax=Saguinus oedipus TaxID=9490 RepID=A0ABQ9V7U1_SAGOE|nr:hypothetical protein P7K49_014937 [Saguinus oedipus]